MIIVGIAIVGIVAGIMSGLFGVGGGTIMVPALVAFLGMDILNANAASLAAMLLPVGILGVINYYKAGFINIKDSLFISLGLLAGSYLGSKLALAVDIHLLAKCYAAFLLYVAISYINIPALIGKKKVTEQDNADNMQHSMVLFIIVGVFAGVIAGMFGKGGGIVIVPILIKFFRYSPKAATATSLAALQLPVGLPSVIVYAENGHLNWQFAAIMAIGMVAGTFIGSKLGIKLPIATFKRVYAVFLLGIAVYMVAKYL